MPQFLSFESLIFNAKKPPVSQVMKTQRTIIRNMFIYYKQVLCCTIRYDILCFTEGLLHALGEKEREGLYATLKNTGSLQECPGINTSDRCFNFVYISNEFVPVSGSVT